MKQTDWESLGIENDKLSDLELVEYMKTISMM